MLPESKPHLYESIIRNFILAYNRFDVEGMLKDVHNDVVFKHISGGETLHTTRGREALRKQAQEAITYFSKREQQITSIKIEGNRVTADIEFSGLLANDMPDENRVNEAITSAGQSIYTFKHDKIIEINDISQYGGAGTPSSRTGTNQSTEP